MRSEQLFEIIADVHTVVQNLLDSGHLDQAIELQAECVEPLEEFAIDLEAMDGDESTYLVFPISAGRIRFKLRGGTMKWSCCKSPSKIRLRGKEFKGESAWGAWCQYEKAGKTGGMVRLVKRAEPNGRLGTAPRKIILKGKLMPMCV